RRQPQVRQTSVESSNLEKPDNPPIVTMADNRTMAQLLEAPTEGFSELHQLDTFYNALNSIDQDSLNSAAGGNFLDKMPRECLKIIESKSKNPHANSQNNFNRGNNFNQNRGNNFNKGQIYRPPVNQPVAHQGPTPQTHGVSKTDFERYVTANDAVLRNMQNQGQNLQSQMANLTDMLSKFVTANTASTSGSGTLPGNTVTNPSGSGNSSRKHLRRPASFPKASIPVPSRRNEERFKEKQRPNRENSMKSLEILSSRLALPSLMLQLPKFASTLKNLNWKQRKIELIGKTPLMKLSVVIHQQVTTETSKIEVIDTGLYDILNEVPRFSNVIASGNPTPYSEPIVSTASPTLTPFGDSDFLLFEEAIRFFL
ncbi:hypothetical protein Tco_0400368, partial [Tanacetum coccineum]